MERIACGVAYEGTYYAGWQYQPSQATLQGMIEKAISPVSNHPVRIIASGRTDQGVHAKNQVFHFDTSCLRSINTWFSAINYYLPHDIQLSWAKVVPNHFHARFSASERAYRYLIYQGPLPWFRRYSWMINHELSINAMQAAAQHLIGEHDFSAFRASRCQSSSPIRRLTTLTIKQYDNCIQLDISANAFLHHMVRNIVAVLVEVGESKRVPADILTLLQTKDRRQASITAPPQGLYLENVTYPLEFKLPLAIKDSLERLR